MPIAGNVMTAMALLAAGSAPAADDRAEEGRRLFEAKIRPVLVQECFMCHSAQARPLKAGLRLDGREALLAGGDSGAAIVPGKPGESLLIHVLEHASEIAMMPPGKRLDEPILDDFRRWVELGAPYPAGPRPKGEKGGPSPRSP